MRVAAGLFLDRMMQVFHRNVTSLLTMYQEHEVRLTRIEQRS